MRDERGAVTAEAALAIPLLTLVTLAMVWMLAFGIGQMKTTDAAREAARALARGDSEAEARALVAAVDPGAHVSISRQPGRVVVTVTRPIAGPAAFFPGLAGSTEAVAVAALEETGGTGPAGSMPDAAPGPVVPAPGAVGDRGAAEP